MILKQNLNHNIQNQYFVSVNSFFLCFHWDGGTFFIILDFRSCRLTCSWLQDQTWSFRARWSPAPPEWIPPSPNLKNKTKIDTYNEFQVGMAIARIMTAQIETAWHFLSWSQLRNRKIATALILVIWLWLFGPLLSLRAEEQLFKLRLLNC